MKASVYQGKGDIRIENGPDLMADVLAGKLDSSPVLDLKVSLDEVPEGYAKMDQRKSIKALVRP